MATRDITLYATAFGEDIGPFDITDNLGNSIAIDITPQQILSTIILAVDTNADTIFLKSKGRCDNTLQVPINAIPPSPTVSPSITVSPSATPSVTPSISISPTRTPSVTVTRTPTLSISITPTKTPTVTTTPSVTPSTSISRTPSATPSITPTITPSTSVTGINSCFALGTTDVYLKVDWTNAGDEITSSGVFDRYGNYCGDNFTYLADVNISFFRDQALTIPVNISNIYFNYNISISLPDQGVSITYDSGLTSGILTNNQSSITFNNVIYQENYADTSQFDECTRVNVYYGMYLVVGCIPLDTISVEQNNTI
jgi:hypothetical protein